MQNISISARAHNKSSVAHAGWRRIAGHIYHAARATTACSTTAMLHNVSNVQLGWLTPSYGAQQRLELTNQKPDLVCPSAVRWQPSQAGSARGVAAKRYDANERCNDRPTAPACSCTNPHSQSTSAITNKATHTLATRAVRRCSPSQSTNHTAAAQERCTAACEAGHATGAPGVQSLS